MFRVSGRLSFALFLFAASSFFAQGACAQASNTASKAAAISVFAGLNVSDPAYGPNRNTGVSLGANYTRYLRFPVQPSVEVRANFSNGTYANERSYLFGLRALVPVGRFEPYADFLVGPGNIHFPLNVGYTGDNSTVYDYGGGVDVPVFRNFALKLDVQAQHWNTGEFTFTPILGTVGISYRIPFRAHDSQSTIIR